MNFKTLLDLSLNDCRWPVADDPYIFCASHVEDGKPYCLEHCAMAYTRIREPSDPKRKSWGSI